MTAGLRISALTAFLILTGLSTTAAAPPGSTPPSRAVASPAHPNGPGVKPAPPAKHKKKSHKGG